MIQTYDIDILTGNIDNMFQTIMKIGFSVSLFLLVFWNIVNLFIWLFGAKKKSEKAIKFGIRNFVLSLILIIFILIIPLLIMK